mmetsp:Transcript_342/g.361  ORF Transcript_342/g.361 Transcript_342/m.361 type:complete len:106 (-) Transcript_342:326-643(-)
MQGVVELVILLCWSSGSRADMRPILGLVSGLLTIWGPSCPALSASMPSVLNIMSTFVRLKLAIDTMFLRNVLPDQLFSFSFIDRVSGNCTSSSSGIDEAALFLAI